ncbi:molybdopterin-guanine dinucleotide biosynthesis protein B [Evansella tamaricis]|uniref:Molybdopterin-guanine dinucleotide biosynthesis protein B n=1 Tax=Evansella tamaricis TaxID=2069301 RepID=A0ABS6JD47_9BACI|nr:molybdopterin-guanine dinucleotide biosynthesis protein B [Evansella tamaricis]MBU9711491.1 molybdopterin-guanine dinucleotide biosynthesis protein B [Evansella tamaricis]
MKQKPIIFQIVGYSNSGKTTLISKWIKEISASNLKVAMIKHHGHQSSLSEMDEGKDTNIHRDAGAAGSLVASNDQVQMHMRTDEPLSLEKLLFMYQLFHLDVILIEGFKKEKYPKLLLYRGAEDRDLLFTCTNVEAIICWKEADKEALNNNPVPVFHLREEIEYIRWLMDRINRGVQ